MQMASQDRSFGLYRDHDLGKVRCGRLAGCADTMVCRDKATKVDSSVIDNGALFDFAPRCRR